MRVPGGSEIVAAWHALPNEFKNYIGIAVVDMVFQSFVYGDGYAPEDRAIVGDSSEARALRSAAADASDNHLNELHRFIEESFPDLFGSAGQNPDWAVAMGAKR